MNIYTVGLTLLGIALGIFLPMNWILISLIPFGLLVWSLNGDGLEGIGAMIIGGLGFFLYLGAAIGIGINYYNGVDINVSITEKGRVQQEKIVQVQESSDINWTKVWNYKPFEKEK